MEESNKELFEEKNSNGEAIKENMVNVDDVVMKAHTESAKANGIATIKKNLSTNKRVAIIIAIILVIVSIAGINSSNNKSYLDKMEKASNEMRNGAAVAESTCNKIKSAWIDSIYDDSDALHSFYVSSEYINLVRKLGESQGKARTLMGDLTNPPEEYEKAYDKLEDLYEVYLSFINLAIYPDCSYLTFQNRYQALKSSFNSKYRSIQLYFE